MMLWEKQTARRTRRPPIGLMLLAGLIVVPLAELAVLIEIGGWLGLGPTLALIILTAAGGTWVLRRQGIAVLRRAQQQMQQSSVPIFEVFEGACLVVAGALLLTPGFLSDTAGGDLAAAAGPEAAVSRGAPPARGAGVLRARPAGARPVGAPHRVAGSGAASPTAGDRCRVRGGGAPRHARTAR